VSTWTENDRLMKQDAEHDIAICVIEGRPPRQDDLDKLRGLIAKRDAFLAAELTPAPIDHLHDLEAAGLRDPAPATTVGQD
jgi:hypothetical protein